MIAVVCAVIHNDTPCPKSLNDFCSFRRVIWLLILCCELLVVYICICVFNFLSCSDLSVAPRCYVISVKFEISRAATWAICIVANFVEFSQTVAEIWRFSGF